METVLMVVHIIIAVLLVGSILLQRSQSDGLQGLSGGSGHDAIFSAKSTANFLSKVTTVLFALFIINCIVLANLSLRESKDNIVTKIEKQEKQQSSIPIAQ
ncbi:MAG: preprotein translocase subunit SecG [Rickettsiales bacterium]